MKKTSTIHIYILLLIALPLLGLSVWLGVQVYETSSERAELKREMARVNDIYYGLLSVSSWQGHVQAIAEKQITEFSLSTQQDSLIRTEIDNILHDMIDQAVEMIQEEDKGFRNKVRKIAVNTFVDTDKLHARVPEFTETIMRNLNDPETRKNLKLVARQKLNELSAETRNSLQNPDFSSIYSRYGANSKEEFNHFAGQRADQLQQESNTFSLGLIGAVVLGLLGWFAVWKLDRLRKLYFLLSLVLAIIVLLVGLSTAMIEIDARIGLFDFVLLGEHIIFTDQMLFYRSKSILEVVNLLLNSDHFDSILVGFLVLAFSVILPISKLFCNGFYLLSIKVRKYKLVRWFAFSSGKWSMADVMVVAIFMSYVAFDGILENQLELLQHDTALVKSITTNNTALRPGFMLFLTYVLYSMGLSVILNKLVKQKEYPGLREARPP